MLIIGMLLILLLIAAWQDIRYYRIPNILVFPATVTGVLLHTLLPQDMGGLGILFSLAGLVVGLVALLPFYLLRAMGAGDIKLMAMIGAFVGPASMLVITVYVLLAGGVWALGIILVRGRLSRLLENLKIMLLMHFADPSNASFSASTTLPESAGKLPYGVAIATGTLVYLVLNH
ncbi:A24 family peptidase [Nitrosomonas communis]|uniref:Prepilin peptidase CpaA n=1 Tax=Nitrosomonas communis TaxID=44574 RepID=A0A1H2QEM4_9PROT|nr:prepilin peptidase [Nitrosomonas communis]SDW05592.1 prepilin peptidase CpaA [Nitrosomonas communis]